MADVLGTTIISKDNDANAIGNPIFTRITDGTDAIAVNADGSLNVTINNASIAVTATDLDIRDLTHVSDSVKVGDGTDFLAVNADGSLNITDNGGSLTVDGTVTVTATNLDIRDLNSATDSVTVVATNLDIRDLSSATDSVAVTDGGGSITVDGSVTVSATDLDIRDLTLATDAVRISANTSANSAVNPIFVSFATAAITGEVHSYNTATVAAAGTSDHTYTATNTFLCKSVICAASGKAKFEVKAGASGGPTSKAVAFVSPNTNTVELHFDPAIEVASGDVLRITRTNRENQSMDVYTTIIGIDA